MERSIYFSMGIFGRQSALRVVCCLATFGALALGMTTPAQATVGREQDIPELRLGQRIKVDDGTCPAGQIKEVSGARMTPSGVERVRKCIPRTGPKMK
jgi:hypothetical protein